MSLDLPTDRTPPATRGEEARPVSRPLLPSRTEALRRASAAEGVTAFVALLGLFAGVLQRHTGQTDVVIGTPVANRLHEETQHVIGLFVNTLALRLDLTGDPSLRELLRRARAAALGAYAHPDLPLALLVEAARPARTSGRPMSLQVIFNFHPFESRPLLFPGLDVRLVDTDVVFSAADLSLYAHEGNDALTLEAVYAADLFETDTVRRLLTHVDTMVTTLIAAPETRLSQVPLSVPTVRVSSARPSMEHDASMSLGQTFTRTARRVPTAVAVESPDGRTTYEELHASARRVAYAVRRERRGGPVLLLHDHDRAMAGSVLGLTMTGRPYVPLDPVWPAARLREIAVDSMAGCWSPCRPSARWLPTSRRRASSSWTPRRLPERLRPRSASPSPRPRPPTSSTRRARPGVRKASFRRTVTFCTSSVAMPRRSGWGRRTA